MGSITNNNVGMLIFGGVSALWAQAAHALGSSDAAALSLSNYFGLDTVVDWWS